ncbi:hypothetical protein D8B26_001362 [Coccidioides posadasii str. Silveira]|uniref:Uncharacterized protein n=2 Tax=Coccidioides posadasii TaxID=199306 RepID=A0A0J6F5L2_COCPO|nr:hypothetical protein CPC735_046460 [Coccidioides posadasii C735 delta SOWgp]EER23276.1 hypothetical protein CPC735_046460 [Coccidioides posadasii C735 delta SOWgp]KMM64590.1 hypothetical protein CPAG_00942 [Coccidioides posadasii RMSCC 3488]QVM06656.1 hypothetical protein D8B26_001362 [Coccidioides posadasii str. Silveira]|eukprot:XP_003065421.1 hypothetical protein CPC735_046460 [Coccidioides posadasii C735 delta SOWgp]
MVLLIITPAILSALESIPQSIRDDLSLPAPALNEAISHSQLITLSRKLSSTDSKGLDSTTRHEPSRAYSLNCLLRGAKLYIPPPPPKPAPTPEYLALKARLEAEAQAKEYHAYLHRPSASQLNRQPSPIFSHSSPTDEHPANTDDDALTPSLVLNILVSILFTGFATYWALTNFRTPQFLSTIFSFSSSNSAYAHNYPGSVYSQPSRVFISLLAAVVVGIAEVGVYAAYLRKVDMAKKKEKRIVEKKTVIGEVGVGSRKKDVDAGPLQDEDREKEEIWGKGVNGGVRRRVRERWKEKQDLEEK